MAEKNKPFSFMSMINNNSKPVKVQNLNQIAETGEDFTVVKIDVRKINPSKHNFYSLENIRELACLIKMFGIRQNLEVTPIPGTDEYRLVAGHRRRLGTLMLLDDGEPEEKFRYVPCRIVDHTDEIEEQIVLIQMNAPSMRQFNPLEYIEQYKRLNVLMTEYKKYKNVPGRVIEHIAEVLGISTSQVERIATIDKKLEPELKDELKSGTISFNAAAELARLSPADQRAVYEKHKETGVTDLKTVREQKEKASKRIEPKPQEETNPTIKALELVKELLDKEIARIKPDNSPGKTVSSEYYRILTVKADEVGRELFQLMGSDMFKQSAGAAEQEA